MKEEFKSPNWAKRLRMSRFVQQGKMSFEKAKVDLLPSEHRQKTFHILLREGMFSQACLVWSGMGYYWNHPSQPEGCFGSRGMWLPDEVVAWQEVR